MRIQPDRQVERVADARHVAGALAQALQQDLAAVGIKAELTIYRGGAETFLGLAAWGLGDLDDLNWVRQLLDWQREAADPSTVAASYRSCGIDCSPASRSRAMTSRIGHFVIFWRK